MQEDASGFYLWDSKTHDQQGFDTLAAAHAALQAWIDRQRAAGEPVVEQPAGQWSDSRVIVWVADAAGRIMPLVADDKPSSA